jgi:hypothetical protein
MAVKRQACRPNQHVASVITFEAQELTGKCKKRYKHICRNCFGN